MPNRPSCTEDEAIIVAFRKHTLLPLDDCLYALQATIPHLTRSSLHRCLQRHGISRLPDVEGDKPAKKKFKAYPIGYFHIDIAEVRTAEGKLYLFVAIDRTIQIRLRRNWSRRPTGRPPRPSSKPSIEAVPYKIHTVLTDNGIQFADLPTQPQMGQRHATWRTCSTCVCRDNGIEHRLTKPNHPWTNGQVERMNRTIKEATVKRYHYDTPRPARTPPRTTSSTPTTSPGGSRPSKASRPTNTSARSGQKTQNDSSSIRSIKCRD